jgi:hypothetical protein
MGEVPLSEMKFPDGFFFLLFLLLVSLELGDAKAMSLRYEPASEPLHI